MHDPALHRHPAFAVATPRSAARDRGAAATRTRPADGQHALSDDAIDRIAGLVHAARARPPERPSHAELARPLRPRRGRHPRRRRPARAACSTSAAARTASPARIPTCPSSGSTSSSRDPWRRRWSPIQAPPGPLPFADGAFDTVLSLDTLEHVPRRDRAGFVAELAPRRGPPRPDRLPDVRGRRLDRGPRPLRGRRRRLSPWLTEHDEYGLPTRRRSRLVRGRPRLRAPPVADGQRPAGRPARLGRPLRVRRRGARASSLHHATSGSACSRAPLRDELPRRLGARAHRARHARIGVDRPPDDAVAPSLPRLRRGPRAPAPARRSAAPAAAPLSSARPRTPGASATRRPERCCSPPRGRTPPPGCPSSTPTSGPPPRARRSTSTPGRRRLVRRDRRRGPGGLRRAGRRPPVRRDRAARRRRARAEATRVSTVDELAAAL